MQTTKEHQKDNSNKTGLIYAYLLDTKGGAKAIGWDEIKNWEPNQGVLWVHLDYKSEEVKKWLNQESNLDPLVVASMTTYDIRPRVLENNDGLLILLRAVNLNPGAKPEDMVSLRVWIDKNRIISTRHRRVLSIEDVNDIINKGRAPKNPSDFLATLIEFIINRMADVIEHVNEHVDTLEQQVLTSQPYQIRTKIVKLRREIISLKRFLSPQRDLLIRLYTDTVDPWISKNDRMRIRESADRIIYYIEDLDEARERAAVAHEELSSRITEQMDQRMFLLSMVAVIFLPLSFITGLLGINVGGIPGASHPWAFPIVSITLIGIAAIELIFFKRKKWL